MQTISLQHTLVMPGPFEFIDEAILPMILTQRIKEAGATGYILLWLLGVPIPILFVIFLLRGCS
jgi:hypothetical protein